MREAVESSNRYIDRVSTLPLSPTLVTQLLQVFREPDKEVDEVVRLISYEPALTAEILKRCNSSYFAGQEPVADIFESVSRLGFYEVYQLVVALFGAGAKSLEGAAEGLNVEELWRHSVTTAVAASMLADEIGESKPVAFTAGLLHDIGKLVLASVERARYSEIVALAQREACPLIEKEREAFGTDHSELGGELMARWKLPEEVVTAVRYHHDFVAAAHANRLGTVVELADLVALDLDEGGKGEVRESPAAVACLKALDCTGEDYERLARATEKELGRVKGLFQI
jgi:putative nucleotidyltransferase with HDIG domain